MESDEGLEEVELWAPEEGASETEESEEEDGPGPPS